MSYSSLPIGIGCVRSTPRNNCSVLLAPWICPCPRQYTDVFGQATHRYFKDTCAVVLRSDWQGNNGIVRDLPQCFVYRMHFVTNGMRVMLHVQGYDCQACGFRLRESDDSDGIDSRIGPVRPTHERPVGVGQEWSSILPTWGLQ